MINTDKHRSHTLRSILLNILDDRYLEPLGLNILTLIVVIGAYAFPF